MKKILILAAFILPLCVSAQEIETETAAISDSVVVEKTLSIAVYSYEKCWNAMEEVAQVKAEAEALRSQYAQELKRAEADFNAKYEDFLEQQAKLAPSIRNKRQAELRKIMEENLAFKAKAQETLENTTQERLQPIKEKLQQSIEAVAKEGGYSIVINKDNNACPFFDKDLVTDITEMIMDKFLVVSEAAQ